MIVSQLSLKSTWIRTMFLMLSCLVFSANPGTLYNHILEWSWWFRVPSNSNPLVFVPPRLTDPLHWKSSAFNSNTFYHNQIPKKVNGAKIVPVWIKPVKPHSSNMPKILSLFKKIHIYLSVAVKLQLTSIIYEYSGKNKFVF